MSCLLFPTYYPVRGDIVSDESWAISPDKYICNGPYSMSAWEHTQCYITLKKNENYIDADSVTMEEIKFLFV